MADDQIRTESNRLYWETDSPVAEIADLLGISRRALYDAIEPRAVDMACPDCGAALVFRNRTAAERRRAECLECELEITMEAEGGLETDDEPQVEQERVAGRASPVRSRTGAAAGSGALLGGSMLAGIAVGATVGFLIRHR